MRTSKVIGFGSGLAKCKGTSKIGLSSYTNDVSEIHLVEVLDGGSESVVVVVVAVDWISETTTSDVVSEAICVFSGGISKTIG